MTTYIDRENLTISYLDEYSTVLKVISFKTLDELERFIWKS